MKELPLILCAMILSIALQSQSLERNVISNAGNFETAANSSIEWSLGETVVFTISDGNTDLLQGFNQPPIGQISIKELGVELNIRTYPNPTKDKVFFQGLPSNIKGELHIFDSKGRQIDTHLLSDIDDHLNLENLSDGMYLIYFKLKDHQINYIVQIQKIH